MSLYRVLLVDDEEDVRSAISKKIDWQALGFTLVAEAGNGNEALELAEQLKPDVIMTDIKMPFMDGLTLAKKVQTVVPGVRVAIFSGFDEFEYAKEAIKLDVIEYILKPIDSKELTLVFKRIKKSLDEEIAEKRNLDKLNKYYEDSLPTMRQQLLFQLLRGNVEPTRLVESLEQYDMDIDSAGYAVAVVSYAEKTLTKERDLMTFSLQEIIEEIVDSRIKRYFVRSMEHMAILFLIPEKADIQNLIASLNQVFLPTKKILDMSISIGVGSLYKDINDIFLSYQEATDALEYQVLTDAGQCIFIGDIEPGTMEQFPINTSYKDEIIRQVKIGSKESLKKAVFDLMHGLRSPKVSVTQYQIIRLELFTELLKIYRAYNLEMSESYLSVFLDDNTFSNIGEAGNWMLEQCENIRQRIRRERKDSTKILVERAKSYIEEHFSDNNLSADDLCNELNVSPTYFSTIFSKEVGQTFVAYLTNARMEKALEYINTTDLKTYEIAESVGYSDANYFSYVFKKENGVSPTNYRRDKVSAGEE